jgi:molecular chaperone GrpE (heat shock protein)
MSDWKESKRVLDEARRLDREAAHFLRTNGFYSDSNVPVETDAATAERAETRRRQREARADQRARQHANDFESRLAALERRIEVLEGEIRSINDGLVAKCTGVLDAINQAVFPALQHVTDNLKAAIKEIAERNDRELREMRDEFRDAIKRERGGDVLDLPSLRDARNIN